MKRNKIGIFLESEYIPSEIDIYEETIRANGLQPVLISDLWGQSSLKFYSGKDVFNDNRDREEKMVSVDFRSIHLDEFAAFIMPANYVSVRFKYMSNSAGFIDAKNAPVVKFFEQIMLDKKITKGFLCHGLWILTPNPYLLNGRKVTCISNLFADINNTGATFENKDVVVDKDLVTGRTGKEAKPFIEEVINQVRISDYPKVKFFSCIKEKNEAEVLTMLSYGFDVNSKNQIGQTGLMIASGLGYSSIVKILLSYGAQVNLMDDYTGNTALHLASMNNNSEVIHLLIDNGAFVNVQNPSQGHTPLIDAVIYKNPSSVKALLDKGADIFIKNRWGFNAINFVEDLLNRNNDQLKNTAFIIKRLLDERLESNNTVKNERSIINACLNRDYELLENLLREEKYDINKRFINESSGNDGHTALLISARDGLGQFAKLLLDKGADETIADGLYKALPIHKACYMNKYDSARTLIEANVNVNAQGPWNGYTPLHDALWQGALDIASLLIERGALLNLKAHNGRTPLDIAIEEYGSEHRIVELIRSKLADNSSISASHYEINLV